MYLSVIIPTCNRSACMKEAVESILKQDFLADSFETIIVDNGSTDDTNAVAEEIIGAFGSRVKYICEPAPGLHNGRHLGARIARGELLVFADDDIIAAPGWLSAIYETFKDPGVALVGGKILPKWEGDLPPWIDLFKNQTEHGWTITYLSLLDFGDAKKDIPACWVYGCNFSIRKTVLYECGGFHPDSIAQELIRYRGDGESGLATKITEKGYRAVYDPEATVFHVVPRERLVIDYFMRRAFNQGVSDSYTEIRRTGCICRPEKKKRNGDFINNLIRRDREHPVLKKISESYHEGREFHCKSVEADPKLFSYVMRESYF